MYHLPGLSAAEAGGKDRKERNKQSFESERVNLSLVNSPDNRPGEYEGARRYTGANNLVCNLDTLAYQLEKNRFIYSEDWVVPISFSLPQTYLYKNHRNSTGIVQMGPWNSTEASYGDRWSGTDWNLEGWKLESLGLRPVPKFGIMTTETTCGYFAKSEKYISLGGS